MKEGNVLSRTAFLVLLAAIVFSLVLPTSASLNSQPAAVHTLDDAAIFAIFDEVNAADIWTARLGAKNCHAQEVCELARMVASDHELTTLQDSTQRSKDGQTSYRLARNSRFG